MWGAVAGTATHLNRIVPRRQRAYEHCVTRSESIVKEFEVNCINKPNRESKHEHITHIGHTINAWRLTREVAIQRIDNKAEAFYTVDPESKKKVYIDVVREAGKNPYLRTHADGEWNNNLLAQQECGTNCKLIA